MYVYMTVYICTYIFTYDDVHHMYILFGTQKKASKTLIPLQLMTFYYARNLPF